WAVQRAVTREGHRVGVAASAEDAFVQARKQPPDAIVLDVRLPGLDGLSALSQLRKLANDAPVVVVTAYGNLATAVRAVEEGAFDYLPKPFDLGHALETINRALHRRALQEQGQPPGEAEAPVPEEIVGRSAVMQVV